MGTTEPHTNVIVTETETETEIEKVEEPQPRKRSCAAKFCIGLTAVVLFLVFVTVFFLLGWYFSAALFPLYLALALRRYRNPSWARNKLVNAYLIFMLTSSLAILCLTTFAAYEMYLEGVLLDHAYLIKHRSAYVQAGSILLVLTAEMGKFKAYMRVMDKALEVLFVKKCVVERSGDDDAEKGMVVHKEDVVPLLDEKKPIAVVEVIPVVEKA